MLTSSFCSSPMIQNNQVHLKRKKHQTKHCDNKRICGPLIVSFRMNSGFVEYDCESSEEDSSGSDDSYGSH